MPRIAVTRGTPLRRCGGSRSLAGACAGGSVAWISGCMGSPSGGLFEAQGVDGAQRGRPVGGVEAEEHADGGADRERERDGVELHRRLHADDLEAAADRGRRVRRAGRRAPRSAPPRTGTGRGCRCARAPIALRMPISRVRSVTVTSMMFMTPMPPTSSEIAATVAEQDGERRGCVAFVVSSSEAWLSTR